MSECPNQFLFCCFCSTDLFALALPNIQGSPPIFIPLTFLHLHLGSPSPNVWVSPPVFILLFLVCSFCSADLALWVSEDSHQFLFCWPFCTYTYQCLMVHTNFYSALTFLHLRLGSLSSNVWVSPPIFIPLFLFCSFCSPDLFALALWLSEGPHQFLFHWPFCTCTYPMSEGPHQFLFHYDLFALSTPIFIPLFLFCCFNSANLFALTTVWGIPVT